jgi:SAM-dependent methyltransferase
MPFTVMRAAKSPGTPSQFAKPTGLVGRWLLWRMNRHHSNLTDWGLGHVAVRETDTVLDVGCGGGRTIGKLAAAASKGSVCGVDYSPASVAASTRTNRTLVEQGRVRVQRAAVQSLPFEAGTFDLVTGVETHFWWGDVATGMREVFRVLKPGGKLVLIVEFYRGGKHESYADRLSAATGIAAWTIDEHRKQFTDAGFADVTLDENTEEGWLCGMGTKPGPVATASGSPASRMPARR